MASNKPPSVIERYFRKHYKTDVSGESGSGEDQIVLTHSNRVCVICLANSHPILRDRKSIAKVNFSMNGANRLDIKLSGKAKRGAQWLDGSAVLCGVTCADGSHYTLTCAVKGQLLEVNEKLISEPQLLAQKPQGEGYLCVMLPGLKWFDKEIANLKSEEEYQTILSHRTQPT